MVSYEPVNDWRTVDDDIMFPGDDQIQGMAALMRLTLHVLL